MGVLQSGHVAPLARLKDWKSVVPRVRPNTAMHAFGTIKCWMGATHFLMRRLRKVSTEMALNVLAYNIKRVIAIVGVGALLEAVTI